MVRGTVHSKTKWLTRGDPSKTIEEAWDDGIRVECPNYSYQEARLDPGANAILLRWGNKIRTVLKVFDTVDYRFVFPVACVECGTHHHNPQECPNCQSGKWMCR